MGEPIDKSCWMCGSGVGEVYELMGEPIDKSCWMCGSGVGEGYWAIADYNRTILQISYPRL